MELGPFWQSCLARYEQFSSRATLNEEWIQLVNDLQAVARMIDSLGLFSTNESLDEACTSSLPFMAVQYWLGMACQKIKSSTMSERKHLILGAQICFTEFLQLLASYEIFKEKTESDSIDPAVKRMVKIERTKRIMALEASFKERRLVLEGRDEELLRQYRLDELACLALKTQQELSLIGAELELLNSREKVEERPEPPLPRHIRRVTRPFTLLKSRREEVKSSVFKPSHNLPTMTIDEYLELERQRGGILEPGAGGEQPEIEVDSDDEEQRQKLIRMDAFKDEHKKGSGNTYNRS